MLESLGSDLTEHLQLFTVWKAREFFGLDLMQIAGPECATREAKSLGPSISLSHVANDLHHLYMLEVCCKYGFLSNPVFWFLVRHVSDD